jgi:5-methylcytosine-specific restriction endonuclease McrA
VSYSKSFNRKDILFRYAIWVCHRYTCAYSSTAIIELSDMELDHIISEEKKHHPDELNIILSRHGLSQDFNLESLYNCVPCTGVSNRKKSDGYYKNMIEIALEKAKKIAPGIEKKVESLKKGIRETEDQVKVKYLLEGNRLKIEEFYNFCTDESSAFTEERFVFENFPYTHYRKSLSKFRLTSILPTRFSPKGSCIIEFKTVRMRNCSITLDHKEILDVFCCGYKTDINLGLRKFIVATDSHNSNTYFVKIGNTHFPIEFEELSQLCDVIDDFSGEYLNKLLSIDNVNGSHAFQPSSLEGGYKLIHIKPQLWMDILRFAHEFDHKEKRSPWNIFDARINMFNVYSSSETSEFNVGYHTSLYSEESDNGVWIVWRPMKNLEIQSDAPQFSIRKVWSASYAYEWLTTRFIPYVAYYSSIENNLIGWIQKKLLSVAKFDQYMYKKFLSNFNLIDYVGSGSFETKYILNLNPAIECLLKNLNNLQILYSTNHRKFILTTDEVDALRLSLLTCLKRSAVNDFQYVCENLRLSSYNSQDKDQVLQSFESYQIKADDNGCVTSFCLDLIFRSFCFLVENKNTLDHDEILAIQNSLKPFINTCHVEWLIEKYL